MPLLMPHPRPRPSCPAASYDIALMERVSDRLGWPPERLNWTCLPWCALIWMGFCGSKGGRMAGPALPQQRALQPRTPPALRGGTQRALHPLRHLAAPQVRHD